MSAEKKPIVAVAGKRGVSYGRFSTNLQNETSVVDQHRTCAEAAQRHGITIIDTFSDKGISGAAMGNRPQLLDLVKRAEAGEFDVVIATDLSRLTRSAADTHRLIAKLKAHGVRCIEAQGSLDTDRKGYKLDAGLKGLMNEYQRDQIRDKVHETLRWLARDGKMAGNLPYGYVDRVPHAPHAKVVQEIFRRFADGDSKNSIAVDLNKRGVPSPWAGKTMRGAPVRGRWLGSNLTKLLRNAVYVGRYSWNKTEGVRDADSGKITPRKRARHEWIVTEHPELRIVDVDTFEQVQRRLGARPKLAQTYGPEQRHILSGMLVCGECGARMGLVGGTRKLSHGGYYRCRTATNGDCTNKATVSRSLAEELIVKPELAKADSEAVIKVALATVRAHFKANPLKSRQLVEELAQLDAEIAQLQALVKSGSVAAKTLDPAIDALYKKRDKLSSQKNGGSSVVPAAGLFQAEKLLRENAKRFREALRSQDDIVAARLALLEWLGEIVCKPAAGKGAGRGRNTYLVAHFPEALGELALVSAAVGGELRVDTSDPQGIHSQRPPIALIKPVKKGGAK